MLLFKSVCIPFVIGWLSATSVTAFASPRLTDSTAASRAAAFCQKIGQPVSATPANGSDLSLAKMGSARVTDSQWFRSVEFPDRAELELDNANGKITRYMNTAFFHRFDHSLPGKAIAQAEAVKRGVNVLKAEGVPMNEFMLCEAREHQDGLTAQGHEWTLRWQRIYKGIPYRNQLALVTLQAETGEVIDAGNGSGLLPPESISEYITRDQASAIGQAQLAAAGITKIPLIWEGKMIIQPDTFWQDGIETYSSNTTHTAWLCGFGSQQRTYGVWIDTQTGDVIGGTLGGTLGGGPVTRQTPVFGHQLKRKDLRMLKL